MTTKREHPGKETEKASQGHVGVGHKHARNEERFRKDRGGQVGSGDEREQADQEEFDRGGHRRGSSRDQAR